MDERADPNADTFDYGLAPGETYEPEMIEEIDRTQPHIMTVLGPVEPGALGVANMASSFANLRDDPAAILSEIEEAGFVGLNAFVNFAPLRTVAEAETARWLAGRCDLHLIVTTGPAGGNTPDSIFETVESGFGDTGVLPGAIVTTLDRAELAAAQRARTASGLPLIVLAGSTPDQPAMLDTLHQAGVDLPGLIIAGDVRDPAPLVDTGVFLLLHIRSREEAPAAAALIARLVKQQLTGQILVGFDPQPEPDPVSSLEASRWSWLIEQFPLMLLDAGLDGLAVRALMIDTPNRALTIDPPATAGSPKEIP